MSMIHIAFGIDEKFVMPCGVTMTSICENNKDVDVFFHILGTSLSDRNKERLFSIAHKYRKQLEFIVVDTDLLKGCYINRGAANGCMATYFRFLLSLLLPNIDKVLYLDGDLVVRSSLKELWDKDIDNVALAACIGEDNDCVRGHNAIGLPLSYGYFNAGVLLINLDYWRKNDVFGKLMNYSTANWGNSNQDQDSLNIVLKDCHSTLDIKYNLQENMLLPLNNLLIDKKYWPELEKAIQNPSIIHYTNSPKPWHKDCVHPFCQEWRYYYNLTEWRDERFKYYLPRKIFVRILRVILSKFRLCDPPRNKFRQDVSLNSLCYPKVKLNTPQPRLRSKRLFD